MIRKMAIFFISLTVLLVSGGIVMYNIRSFGSNIVTSIYDIDATKARGESAGYSEASPNEIPFRRILKGSSYLDSSDYVSPAPVD